MEFSNEANNHLYSPYLRPRSACSLAYCCCGCEVTTITFFADIEENNLAVFER